jgi:radical SAM superfamily enzyme YgiQ (UPF0313 family)
MTTREHTRCVRIGTKQIGAGNPILIQSMTNTKTEDVEATVSQILALEAAGCELIRFGVETFNQHTLDILNKRTDVQLVKQSIRIAQEVGITEIRLSMMLGLPGETDEDVDNTLKTCHEFPGVYFKFFSLYPAIGTELYSHLERYGVTMLATDALIGHSQIHTATMDNQRINYWIQEAYRQFHDPEEDYHRDFSTIVKRG